MKNILCIVLLCGLCRMGLATEPFTVRLWEGEAPGALGSEEKDIPTAIVYLPGSQTPGDDSPQAEEVAKPTGAIVYKKKGSGTFLVVWEIFILPIL